MDARTSWSNYLKESSRPLASLLFVAPLLLAYEGGVLLLGSGAVRNGADVWLRHWLDQIGFSQYFLLPMLTCGLLLAWHHTRRETWQVDWSVCYGMLAESAVFGGLLLTMAHLQGSIFDAQVASTSPHAAQAIAQFVGYIGAGIYEELLFRLMLLPLAILGLRAVGVSDRASIWISVIGASVIFAAAHYQFDFDVAGVRLAMAHGEAFQWFSFTFRVTAGVMFSILFIFRGFGIAVGAHALYDILVLVM